MVSTKLLKLFDMMEIIKANIVWVPDTSDDVDLLDTMYTYKLES